MQQILTKVDDITILQRTLIRNTVTDNLVDGSANALRVTMVVERAGIAIPLDRLFEHDFVNLIRGHAGCDL